MTLPASMDSEKASVVMVHNFYRSSNPSGENRSFEDERSLLESMGHRVTTFTKTSDETTNYGPMRKALLSLTLSWSGEAFLSLKRLLESVNPDVVHIQNTFPLISPSALYAARSLRVPIVLSIRNFRFTCVNAQLFRDGAVCEECLGKSVPWRGVWNASYRGSRAASASVAAMIGIHRLLKTWERCSDLYVVPSKFAADKLIEAGLEASKIRVKSNFVWPDPGLGQGTRDYFLYVGRLTEEKGLRTMLAAWSGIPSSSQELRIAGSGPLAHLVKGFPNNSNLKWLGQCSPREVLSLMQNALAVICPYESYETFGRVAVEAFACGTPVVASNHGALPELIKDGQTGFLVRPGDHHALREALLKLAENTHLAQQMGRAARQSYLENFTADQNYLQLSRIYEEAISIRAKKQEAQKLE